MGYKLAGVHGLGSCPRAQVHFPVHLHAFQCQVFFLFSFFFIFSFGIFLSGVSSHGNINLLKTPLLPARVHLAARALFLHCSSPGHRHIPAWVSRAGWMCRRSERGCMCLASPGARAVEGLSGESNTPGSVPSSSAPAARPRTVRYFPASLLSLCWPQTRPPPRCQVSTLLPRTFTQQWHQTPGLRGHKSPHKRCNKSQQWGKKPEITKLPAMPRAG